MDLGVDSPEYSVYLFRYDSKPCTMEFENDNRCNFGETVSCILSERIIDVDESDVAVADMTR